MSKLRVVVPWFKNHRTAILGYSVVMVAFVASYAGVLATKPLFVPDSQYYLGMTLWFGGFEPSAATEQVIATAQAFGYENGVKDAATLFGSGVVQPRVVLPALSIPFVWLFGPNGLAIVSAIACVAFVLFTTRILSDRYGMIAAVSAVTLAMSSLYIVWYSTAMLTDSLSALWGAVLLFLAWRYQQNPTKVTVMALVATTLLAGFTRQSTLIPAGAFAVAWVMSLLIRPRSRGWGIPAISVGTTTVVVQLAQSLIFAPVNLDDSRVEFEAPTNAVETIFFYAKRARHLLEVEFRTFATYDHALLVLICLSIVATIIFWKRAESHLLVGALIGLAIYNVGNGTPTAFRYAIPGLVFYLAVFAMFLSQLAPRSSSIRNPESVEKSVSEGDA